MESEDEVEVVQESTLPIDDWDLVYDCLVSIRKAATVFVEHINEQEPENEKLNQAYKDGVYSVGVKLSMILSEEVKQRGKERHEAIAKRLAEFLASKGK